ncbi:hypothetical protein HNV12_04560 [Methanococcoides sp. SA1]|nr:hypothetical protein [Methanococcoides sp. SA1]
MIQKRSFIKYTIILQVFILLFAIATIPVSASSEASPIFPLIVGGEITIDGEVAPVGTEISVKLGEDTVGTTTVGSAGVYGDSPSNRLLITSEPDDYKNLKFYVNGVETDLVDLTNAVAGVKVTTVLTSSAPTVDESPDESSSMGGSFAYSETQDSSDEVEEIENTPSAADEVEIETTNEEVPYSEAESSSLIGGLFGLILVSSVGAVLLVKRKNK